MNRFYEVLRNEFGKMIVQNFNLVPSLIDVFKTFLIFLLIVNSVFADWFMLIIGIVNYYYWFNRKQNTVRRIAVPWKKLYVPMTFDDDTA